MSFCSYLKSLFTPKQKPIFQHNCIGRQEWQKYYTCKSCNYTLSFADRARQRVNSSRVQLYGTASLDACYDVIESGICPGCGSQDGEVSKFWRSRVGRSTRLFYPYGHPKRAIPFQIWEWK